MLRGLLFLLPVATLVCLAIIFAKLLTSSYRSINKNQAREITQLKEELTRTDSDRNTELRRQLDNLRKELDEYNRLVDELSRILVARRNTLNLDSVVDEALGLIASLRPNRSPNN